ncbi:albusnodin/ikarugamycin family macrolactam cyclase [Streptomyces sp. NPDC059649]|uniref:albusnodin/ikarugamycin family macrolactam cyclase n=1 Tax=Streptomyces sp. NPDC059649 TaxID=3346895 RepID=UPI00367A7CBA
MKWFGGCGPGGRPVVPAGARLIWDDPPLWTVGAWPDGRVRTVADGGTRLAVFGPCSADERDLARALVAPDLSTFGGAWAGTHAIVRTGISGQVEVLGDAAGACPVYTVRLPDGGVVWGSSSWALSGLTDAQVNKEWLAAYLLDVQADTGASSAWTGVDLVPAGHQLTMPGGSVARVSSWWTIRRRPYGEAVGLLRDALVEGVRTRVQGVPTSSDVAGLDSSTLAVLATHHGPVMGMTVHPAGNAEGGDVTYARELAKALPRLRHELFPLDERHLPLSNAERMLPATDEPAPSSSTWSRLSAQLEAIGRAGVLCHLTGDGGDTLFLPPPTHLCDLARAGNWGRLIVDAQSWALLRRVSPWGLLKAAARRDRYALVGGGGARPVWLSAAIPHHLTRAHKAEGLSDSVLLGEAHYVARSARTEQQLADIYGIELHNPYLDGRIVDAVLSVGPQYRCSTTRYKPLLADAVGPLLPYAVGHRQTKGVFVGEFHRGMRANLRRVISLADGRLAGLGLVEPAPLRAALHAAALGAKTAWPALLPVLNAEMWLAAIERSPSIEWHGIAERAR